MLGSQTTPLEPSPEHVSQSRPSGPPIHIPDFSRPRPVDYSILPEVFRPDPIVEAYKQAKLCDPEAVRHIDFLVGMDRDDFKPYMVDFLNFAAFAGLKRHHDASFQTRVEQHCHAIGSGLKPMSWAEAGHGIKDALQRSQQLRIGVIVVILRARAHLFFPEDPFIQEIFRIVTSLGYGTSWSRSRSSGRGLRGLARVGGMRRMMLVYSAPSWLISIP